jgi:3-phosphoshikimate 1-carboxyvinyltransferase
MPEMPSVSTATITPARRVHGRLRLPGDKSIAHRYALLAAIAHGTSRLTNYAPGADCQTTLACLEALGVPVSRDPDGSAISIVGRGFNAWRSPHGPLDAGNSGTTMRMMAGLLAAQPFSVRMIGDASLSRRPMRRVMEPLLRMGARIEATNDHAPLDIHGAPLHGINFQPVVPSAQVKSAVLLAGLHAEGSTTVTEPAQTRDHTERALATFGYAIEAKPLISSVRGGQQGRACSVEIPGDFSSAAFWFVAAAALPGSRIDVEDVGLNPTRTALLDVLRRFGARVTVTETVSGVEPRGTVTVEADRQSHLRVSAEEVPGLIDELPAIAALAAHTGEVEVRGAAELRVKESDRITTLVNGLRALGIDADEYPDGFVVRGHGAPSGGVADAEGDHRMAMAFAVAGLAGRAPSRVEGADAVAISYPGFFETLERLVA